ncbi:MAG: TlpA family protein disulfide reductase [Rubrivivax sp.]|nr:TlpA family protein disulfide reductase [Rubrivivax sp.]
MKRRTWAIGALAAAAAGAGAWFASQRTGSGGSGPADLWQRRFVRPEGGEFSLGDFRGRVLVLNFWATWCPPCVKEMPELDRLQREQGPAGVQVVGLAIDQPDSVRRFLKQTPVSFPIGLAGFEGSEIGRQLGNSAGGLPFTAVFDRQGQVVERKLGPTDFAELSGWVARIRS